MTKIIGATGSGKTKELMLKAVEDHATLLCEDPIRMRYKAEAYGIPVTLDSYDNLYSCENKIYIDDLEKFLKRLNPYISGFNVSVD